MLTLKDVVVGLRFKNFSKRPLKAGGFHATTTIVEVTKIGTNATRTITFKVVEVLENSNAPAGYENVQMEGHVISSVFDSFVKSGAFSEI